MRLLLVVAAAAAASFLKILSPTPVFPYISRWALLPWRSARSQFRILLLPIFRFFRLSPSSSFRSALPLSLAVGSVTLREPTAVRTFLFQTRLLFSLRFSPRLSFLSTLSSLSSFLPFLLPALLSPFLRPLSPFIFSTGFLRWLPSPRILQPCTGPDNSFSSFDHRLSYHRLFAPTAPRMKARIYSYPMSSRIAWHFCQISPRPVN